MTTPGSGLLPTSRRDYLLRELQLRGSVRASRMAERLGVAEVTVRRDIIELERRGLAVRIHGGAIAPARRQPRPAQFLIGIVLAGGSGRHATALVGLEEAARSARMRLVRAVSDDDVEIERRQLDRLVGLGADGLVLDAVASQGDDELRRSLSLLAVPVVLLERRLAAATRRGAVDTVSTDMPGTDAVATAASGLSGPARRSVEAHDNRATTDGSRRRSHGTVGWAIGRQALQLLRDRLADEDPNALPARHVLVEQVPRTGPLPGPSESRVLETCA